MPGRLKPLKPLRPTHSTVVNPTEYDIEEQFRGWLQHANANGESFSVIDVGKVWGLFEAWIKARDLLVALRYGVFTGQEGKESECPFCHVQPVTEEHEDECALQSWIDENVFPEDE